MCGIVGIVADTDVNQDLYDALTVLQHRGQDSAGIATCEGQTLHAHKGEGLVRDVFRTRNMLNLRGGMGIGHCRYPTAGGDGGEEAQPFYTNAPFGICLAHNGNLVNAGALKSEVFKADRRHVNTDSDSEILLNVFAHELSARGKFDLDAEDVFAAVANVHRRCKGGYAVVGMIVGAGVFAFRDPNGIRPLAFGRKEAADGGASYMVASESVALDAVGYELVRDLKPGEALFIDREGHLHSHVCADQAELVTCIFEYVYLARPDSIIDGVSVHQARLRMGESLAERILELHPDHDIDVVIPIPDTSRTAALPLAQRLGAPYREGFVKNRYIGRTFIMPGQQVRKKSVRQKLNPIQLEFEGKNVLLVDDSIVRGNTAEQIIQMARDAGAKRVYLASAAPPVKYPNVYGIDMPVEQELVAFNRTDEQVAKLIGADWLVYQTVDDLVASTAAEIGAPRRFDLSCFTGEYITGNVTHDYLYEIAEARRDSVRAERVALADST